MKTQRHSFRALLFVALWLVLPTSQISAEEAWWFPDNTQRLFLPPSQISGEEAELSRMNWPRLAPQIPWQTFLVAEDKKPEEAPAQTAQATLLTYKVKLGDNLSRIAKKRGVALKDLKEVNLDRVKDHVKWTLKPGQELVIPVASAKPDQPAAQAATVIKKPGIIGQPSSRKVRLAGQAWTKAVTREELRDIRRKSSGGWWTYEFTLQQGQKPKEIKRLGSNPYRGKIEDDIDRFAFPLEVEKALLVKIAQGDGQSVLIPFGEVQEAINYGNGGMIYLTAITDTRALVYEAVEYAVNYQGYIYRFARLDKKWCGNWTRRSRVPVPIPPPPPPPGNEGSGEEGGDGLPGMGAPGGPVPVIPVVEYDIEHEPIIWIWLGGNDVAGWGGIYPEYMAWWRKKDPITGQWKNGWAPGLGVYGAYSEGLSHLSAYEWSEGLLGGQAGIKYLDTWNSPWGENLPWQWQFKLRLVEEWVRGSNSQSGYWNKQDTTKLGFYTELVAKLTPDLTAIAIGEGWFGLSSSFISSWRGDHASDRTYLGALFGLQYQVNEDLAIRGLVGPFYQGWDHLTGGQALLEGRLNLGYSGDVFMFGPRVAFFPFGLSDAYNGISASALTTWTGFARVELGPVIRDWDRQQRQDSVHLVD